MHPALSNALLGGAPDPPPPRPEHRAVAVAPRENRQTTALDSLLILPTRRRQCRPADDAATAADAGPADNATGAAGLEWPTHRQGRPNVAELNTLAQQACFGLTPPASGGAGRGGGGGGARTFVVDASGNVGDGGGIRERQPRGVARPRRAAAARTASSPQGAGRR